MINVIKYLGVIFHSALTFDKQMYSVVKGSFFHLRTIAKLKSFLSFKDLEIVIHALMSSRIDCFSHFSHLADALIQSDLQ